MRLPRPLVPGDAIALVTPSRFADDAVWEAAAAAVTAAGFRPVFPPSTDRPRDGSLGGTDAERAAALNRAFRDPDIRAVWALRGGYGAARLLPLLESDPFIADPTWIIGFSDITALHAWAAHHGVGALHAPVALTLDRVPSADRTALWHTLQTPTPTSNSNSNSNSTSNSNLNSNLNSNSVCGGNLSVLYSLLGTPWFPKVDGQWLFFEDLDEYMYHLDRMFLAFRLAGVFDRIAGLALGGFTELHDHEVTFGRDLAGIVRDHVPAGVPVVWGVPVGHGDRNAPLVLGAPWDPESYLRTHGDAR